MSIYAFAPGMRKTGFPVIPFLHRACPSIAAKSQIACPIACGQLSYEALTDHSVVKSFPGEGNSAVLAGRKVAPDPHLVGFLTFLRCRATCGTNAQPAKGPESDANSTPPHAQGAVAGSRMRFSA